ncbi:hypothetical protein, partial [Actinomadura rubrisoli]|uniref:hypothetical protein n=1 Tax=Actinomadura rubrisoli TaxID=2530368 RepID=UPI0014049F31
PQTPATATGAAPVPASGAGGGLNGEIRPILFADIVAFSGANRTDTDRLVVRKALYAVLQEAFKRSGVPWDRAHCEDRGDGALIVLPADVPAHLVLGPLAAHIATGLRVHNRSAASAVRIRLRLALDAGPVTGDAHGVSGSAIIHAARLLDAAEFKRRMAGSPAELGLIVSGYVYDSVVKHAPGRVDPSFYQRIDVAEKETRAHAWIALAGQPGPGERSRCDGGPARSGARAGDHARAVRAARPYRRTPDGAAAAPRRG